MTDQGASLTPIRHVETRGGAAMPVLGLGTFRMGEDSARRAQEVAALKLGLDLGMSLIDTAEMYAGGRAEEIVAEAMAGRRDEIFLVTKVMASNASRTGTIEAAERSLGRLATECIDLYLLHWKSQYPIEETLEAFDQLVREHKIRHYGVSNFTTADMRRAESYPLGRAIASNQVVYSLGRRDLERDLLPWCRDRRVSIMAHSPLDQGHLRTRAALKRVAERHGVSPECIAIAWTMRHPEIVSIPKASNPDHLRSNFAALNVDLSAEDLKDLDGDYPA